MNFSSSTDRWARLGGTAPLTPPPNLPGADAEPDDEAPAAEDPASDEQ